MTESRDWLLVSEIFHSLQGEGPSTGKLASFIRLGGCNLQCVWCLAPETSVLMADWTEKPLYEVKPGDFVMSFRNRRYEASQVEKVILRENVERIAVNFNGTSVISTPDHVFCTAKQKADSGGAQGHGQNGGISNSRTQAKYLAGRHLRITKMRGWSPDEDVRSKDWRTGWCQGYIHGDGHVEYRNGIPRVFAQSTDKILLDELVREAIDRGVRVSKRTTSGVDNHRLPAVRRRSTDTASGKPVWRTYLPLRTARELIGLPETRDEIRGWVAGFFDAEGHTGRNQLSMSQHDAKTLMRLSGMLDVLEIEHSIRIRDEECKYGCDVKGSIVVNGLENIDSFFELTRPLLTRKSNKHRTVPKLLGAVPVTSVIAANNGPVVNLTTTSGYFFANGALVEQCDTPYTWAYTERQQKRHRDGKLYDPVRELSRVPIGHAADRLINELIVITGGEPLLQQKQLAQLIDLINIRLRYHEFEIETAGTIVPTDLAGLENVKYNVSVKLASSENEDEKRLVPSAISWFAGHGGRFKFVVADPSNDLPEIEKLCAEYSIPHHDVWLQPEGITQLTVVARLQRLAPIALSHGYNLSTRQHILAFGNQRGT